jgi:hypothetical protein
MTAALLLLLGRQLVAEHSAWLLDLQGVGEEVGGGKSLLDIIKEVRHQAHSTCFAQLLLASDAILIHGVGCVCSVTARRRTMSS